MLHTIIFFTLCQVHPHAKRDYYKHQKECLSKAMLHDLINSYYHFLCLLAQFSFTLIASFAHHYIKDSKIHKHKHQKYKTKKIKQTLKQRKNKKTKTTLTKARLTCAQPNTNQNNKKSFLGRLHQQ